MKSTVDTVAARELALYAENDHRTYTQSITPICENLHRKVKRGTYNAEKAVKAFEYAAEYAARRYASEFATAGEWFHLFNKATRTEAAAELLEFFQDMILG